MLPLKDATCSDFLEAIEQPDDYRAQKTVGLQSGFSSPLLSIYNCQWLNFQYPVMWVPEGPRGGLPESSRKVGTPGTGPPIQQLAAGVVQYIAGKRPQ